MARSIVEKRQAIRERSGGAVEAQDANISALEQEAASIKKMIQENGGVVDDGPSPAQEAEAEANAKPALLAPNGSRIVQEPSIEALEAQARKLAALAAQKRKDNERQATGILHTKELADIVESAYQDFQRRGHEPTTAANLTLSYMIGEIGSGLVQAIKK